MSCYYWAHSRYFDVYVYAMALSPLGDSFVKMNVTFHREYTEGRFFMHNYIMAILHLLFSRSAT